MTEEKICVKEFITKQSEVCITMEEDLSITEKEKLRITENGDSCKIIDEVETGETSYDTDDGSDDTNDQSTDEEKKINTREAVKFSKLYRLLRDGEDITKGLNPKNPFSNISVAEHVACGSNGGMSRYISTCSNRNGAETLRNLKSNSRRFRNGTKQIVVEIDVNQLPLDVKIIDLTERRLREQYEHNDSDINRKFHDFAERFYEVLLEGTVPSHCLVLFTL